VLRLAAARGERERGSASVELALIAPALLLVFGLVVLAGRVVLAGGAVEQVAAAGARAASLARDPATASTMAIIAAKKALAEQHLQCDSVAVTVDTSGFSTPLGHPAAVSIRVDCEVQLGDLSLPGVPGHRTVTAHATSPLDPYRGRTTSGGRS
jgi:Flp pilus assembly protein TadG